MPLPGRPRACSSSLVPCSLAAPWGLVQPQRSGNSDDCAGRSLVRAAPTLSMAACEPRPTWGILGAECREAWSAPALSSLVVASAGEHMVPGVFVCPEERQSGGRGRRAEGRLAVGMAHAPEVVVILGLLVIVAVVAAVVRYVRIPYTVALVLTGLALALLPDVPRVQLTPGVILTIFLPVLLFYGPFNIDLADLRANLAPITLLALPGVVALLFGTIVAATDPVAVLSIFGEVGAPRRLATIVTGESLFNDGTALVFFAAALEVATAHRVDAGRTAEHFVVAVLGGLILGVTVGVVG